MLSAISNFFFKKPADPPRVAENNQNHRSSSVTEELRRSPLSAEVNQDSDSYGRRITSSSLAEDVRSGAPSPKRIRKSSNSFSSSALGGFSFFSKMSEIFVKRGSFQAPSNPLTANSYAQQIPAPPEVSALFDSTGHLNYDFQFRQSSPGSSRKSSTSSSSKSDFQRNSRRKNGLNRKERGFVKNFLRHGPKQSPQIFSPPVLIDLTGEDDDPSDASIAFDHLVDKKLNRWNSSENVDNYDNTQPDTGTTLNTGRFAERICTSRDSSNRASVSGGSDQAKEFGRQDSGETKRVPYYAQSLTNGELREDDDVQVLADFHDASSSFSIEEGSFAQSTPVKMNRRWERPPFSSFSSTEKRPAIGGLSFRRSKQPKQQSQLPGFQMASFKTAGNVAKRKKLKSVHAQCVNLEEKQRYLDLLKNFSGSNEGSGIYSPTHGYSLTQKPINSPTNSILDEVNSVVGILNDLTLPRGAVSPRQELEEERVKEAVKSPQSNELDRRKSLDRSIGEELSKRLELDPDELVNRIRNEYMRSAKHRREEAERYAKEVELRKLDRLNSQKSLEDEIRNRLRLEGLVLEEPEEEVDEFPELTQEQEEEIDNAFYGGQPMELLVTAFRIPVHRKDIKTLEGQEWLNDEIINYYMNLIVERGGTENYPKVYACTTFFYPKLMGGGHAAVKRWTKKVDIFSYDKILVPVHLGLHWCMAVIDFKLKMIRYYDSLGGSNEKCLLKLEEYLIAESQEKKGHPLDTGDWTLEHATNIPHQQNGSDCGMFSCKFAEFFSRDAKITFSQEHIPYFRRRMVYEILKKRLL